jgi:hypothetical protein
VVVVAFGQQQGEYMKTNNTYQPNFNDPRVQARITRALGFACGVMSETKSHAWSSRYIDKYLGKSNNPLSKYLRKTLLIITDEFYRFNSDKNKCKEYRLNAEGVRFLSEALKTNNIQLYPSVLQVALEDHQQELGSGNFQYNDLSNRLWHPLQRYRKQYRTQILADAGYIHDYDIECAAPTLIHQYAQQRGMDEYLFALRKYIADRTVIRQQLAHEIELPVEAVKEIINALFAGARIANHSESDIYNILNGDPVRIEFLKQNPFLTELREDIKTCWSYITPHMSRRSRTQSNGRERLLPVSSRDKWNVYFSLERKILNSVREYLYNKDIKHFLIHDGWTCESEIDREELIEYVRVNTGYEVKFEYSEIDNIQLYPSVLQVQ